MGVNPQTHYIVWDNTRNRIQSTMMGEEGINYGVGKSHVEDKGSDLVLYNPDRIDCEVVVQEKGNGARKEEDMKRVENDGHKGVGV